MDKLYKKMICSLCGELVEFSYRVFQDPKTKEWHCEHDNPAIGTNRIENLRKENLELTLQAQRMAQQAKLEEASFNPNIPIAPPEEVGRFGGDTVQIKKSVLDSLESKKPLDAP